jgi:GNAT superfamily N-acetyltransferase
MLVIRLATLNEISALMLLVRKVVPLMRAAGNLQWDDAYPNATVFERDIELRQLWAADIDGSIGGFAAITTDQSPEYVQVGWDITVQTIVVHRLAVDPDRYGLGIATALMKKAEAVAAELGINTLRVDTNTHNEATQKLFPKLGYFLAGTITLDFRPGQRFLCYEKHLPEV